ncbi:hypothetical protein LTR84_007748 [Exophiala bonariae]|uniref:Uncharacterized protein n=1 Tax=Exophiala bonariae TaxID=1690606 RepID=A0AAV9NKY4_9EURO|nr:hypothetical protein LTR84_007748 [Exophiala bonariae]
MPRDSPISVRFIDLYSHLEHRIDIAPNTGFPQFLCLLTEVSGQVAQHIQGVARPPIPNQGFTTSDGPWWYRIVRSDGSHKPAGRDDDGEVVWRILNSAAAFDFLLGDMTMGVDTAGGWVEVEHNQQKTRDEGELIEVNLNQALERVKDTIRSGYDSRVTSMEFQDNGEPRLGPQVPRQPNMGGGAQVPMRLLTREFNLPVGRHLYPQTHSAPHTPYGLPDLMTDPDLRGPPTGVSLPTEGVSSTFVGSSSNTNHALVTAPGQPTVSPFPASSPVLPGSDSLLGATAHYESRETRMHLPPVVDSSVIREADVLESFPPLEMIPASTMPTSTVHQVTPGLSQYQPVSYPYGPHSTLATFNPLPPHDVAPFQYNSGHYSNRDQGPPPGLFGPPRSRGRGYVNDYSYPKNNNGLRDAQSYSNGYQFGQRDASNDRLYHKHNFGQRNDQGHVSGNRNGGRRKSSADFANRAFRGDGSRSENQMYRGQTGRSRNRAGPGFNMMEDHQAQTREFLPYSDSAIPPQSNAQYHPMFEPHMQSGGYPGMMGPVQAHPPTYGYGVQPQYPRAERDWTTVSGVNTDLMTESEIAALNRQGVEQANVQNTVPQVIVEKPQTSAAVPAPVPELPKTATRAPASVVARKKKNKEPLQVRDVQTALDVTVTDPDLAKSIKNGSKPPPVTKFPGKLTFGKAPHVMPINLRESMEKRISAAATKRHATRRANETKAKVQAEQNQVAKQELRVKQNNNRAARAQRRESRVFGKDDA